jgi:hypothetical protein
MTDTLPAPAPPAGPVPPGPDADTDDVHKRLDALGEELASYRILRDSWASALFVLAAIIAIVAAWTQLSPVVQSTILWAGWPVLGVITVLQTLSMFGKLIRRQRGYRV